MVMLKQFRYHPLKELEFIRAIYELLLEFISPRNLVFLFVEEKKGMIANESKTHQNVQQGEFRERLLLVI